MDAPRRGQIAVCQVDKTAGQSTTGAVDVEQTSRGTRFRQRPGGEEAERDALIGMHFQKNGKNNDSAGHDQHLDVASKTGGPAAGSIIHVSSLPKARS